MWNPGKLKTFRGTLLTAGIRHYFPNLTFIKKTSRAGQFSTGAR